MKKKRLRKIGGILFGLMLVLSICFANEKAYASEINQNSLSVKLTTDKSEYKEKENVECTLYISNEGTDEIKNIKINDILPEDYTVDEKFKTQSEIKSLKASESITLKINCSYKKAAVDKKTERTDSSKKQNKDINAIGTNAKTSDSLSVTRVLALIALMCISVVVIISIIRHKKGKKFLSILLCVTILGTSLNLKNVVYAAESDDDSEEIYIEEKVKINGEDKSFAFNIHYQLNLKNDSEDNNNDEFSAEINVNDLNDDAIIETEKEKINLTGTVTSTEKVKKVSYLKTSEADKKEKEGNAEGTNKWKIKELSVDIGTNYITILAWNKYGKKVTKKITVVRNSTYAKGSDNAIAFDTNDPEQMKEVEEIYNQMLGSWTVEDQSENANGNWINFAVQETNPLYKYILDGTIKNGTVIYIPSNEYFLSGLTVMYQFHDDECNDDIENYEASTCEVIHTKEASIMDLLDDDLCINSDEMDEENPIAFVYTSGESEISNGTETYALTEEQIEDDDRDFDYGSDEDVVGPGFQKQNIKKMVPTFNGDMLDDGIFKIDYDKIILWDTDGNKETKADRIVFDGNISITDLKPTAGIEWHPSEKLPNQMISTLEYTETQSIKITEGGDLGDLENVVKMCNQEFENSVSLPGMNVKIEGADVKNSIFLACVGINLNSSVRIGINNIKAMSTLLAFSPVLVLTVIADLTGKVSVTGSIEYKETSYNKKGCNLQQSNFIGKYGAQKDNIGTENTHISKSILIPEDYDINIYNINAKSKKEIEQKPQFILNILVEGQLEGYTGVGVGIGLMVCGIMPILIKGTIGTSVKGDLYGQALFSNYKLKGKKYRYNEEVFKNGLYLSGYCNGEMTERFLIRADIDMGLAIKASYKMPKFSLKKELAEYEIASKTFSSLYIRGKITQSDTQEDTDIPLENADVSLRRDGSLDTVFSAKTDKNGEYKIANLATTSTTFNNTGTYILTVHKDGYMDYVQKDVSLSTETLGHTPIKDYFNQTYDACLHKSVNKNGYVYEVNKDGELQQDKPIAGVNIELTLNKEGAEVQKYQSDENGHFNIADLKAGSYTLKMTKEGYQDYLDTDFEIQGTEDLNLGMCSTEIQGVCRIGYKTYDSLQAAVEASSPGDTIYLYADDCSKGEIGINHDLTITAISDVHSEKANDVFQYITNNATLTMNAVEGCRWDLLVSMGSTLIKNQGVLNVGEGVVFHSDDTWTTTAIENYNEVNINTDKMAFNYLANGIINFGNSKYKYNEDKRGDIFVAVRYPINQW